MKTHKEHRLKYPKEKEFHDKFIKYIGDGDSGVLESIVFGINTKPLSEEEANICLSLVQWLGSHVGQGFLEDCGFVPKKANQK